VKNAVASRRAGVCHLPVLSAPFPGARWGGAAGEKIAEKTLRERQGEIKISLKRNKNNIILSCHSVSPIVINTGLISGII